jgi:hypothetical protein
MRRLPHPAPWLLRLSRVPREMRAEVQADLHELFAARRSNRGAVYAHWRLYHDVASLWLQRWPVVRPAIPRLTLALLRDARGDLRYAARLFRRQPAILLLTVVGLSLGLAIATAGFSIMNAALRGEGLVDPDRAPGILRATDRSTSTAWKYGEFLRLREGSTRMQVEAALTETAQVRTSAAEVDAPSTGVAFVSGGFFSATGGRVSAGRPLAAADEPHTGPPPVVDRPASLEWLESAAAQIDADHVQTVVQRIVERTVLDPRQQRSGRSADDSGATRPQQQPILKGALFVLSQRLDAMDDHRPDRL